MSYGYSPEELEVLQNLQRTLRQELKYDDPALISRTVHGEEGFPEPENTGLFNRSGGGRSFEGGEEDLDLPDPFEGEGIEFADVPLGEAGAEAGAELGAEAGSSVLGEIAGAAGTAAGAFAEVLGPALLAAGIAGGYAELLHYLDDKAEDKYVQESRVNQAGPDPDISYLEGVEDIQERKFREVMIPQLLANPLTHVDGLKMQGMTQSKLMQYMGIDQSEDEKLQYGIDPKILYDYMPALNYMATHTQEFGYTDIGQMSAALKRTGVDDQYNEGLRGVDVYKFLGDNIKMKAFLDDFHKRKQEERADEIEKEKLENQRKQQEYEKERAQTAEGTGAHDLPVIPGTDLHPIFMPGFGDGALPGTPGDSSGKVPYVGPAESSTPETSSPVDPPADSESPSEPQSDPPAESPAEPPAEPQVSPPAGPPARPPAGPPASNFPGPKPPTEEPAPGPDPSSDSSQYPINLPNNTPTSDDTGGGGGSGGETPSILDRMVNHLSKRDKALLHSGVWYYPNASKTVDQDGLLAMDYVRQKRQRLK